MNLKYYRSRARLALSGNWLLSALVAIVAGLLGGTLVLGSGGGGQVNIDEQTLAAMPAEAREILLVILAVVVPVLAIYGLICFILGGTVRLGYCKYLLDQQDNQPLKVGTLFSQFHQFGNGICLHILTALFTALWSLLFIVPGIIANYRYAMAPFIQAEHPEYTASQCISMSKDMMRGRKWELFCLDLSFIGWILLCALTLGIGYLFLTPYTNASRAAFYREMSPRPFFVQPTVDAEGETAI